MNQAQDFLRALWRGGNWAYYWAIMPDGTKPALWFKAQQPPAVPAAWAGAHVYMGVNTCAEHGNQGTRALARLDPAKPNSPPVALVQALIAEWDAKGFAQSKAAARAHVGGLCSRLPRPSVVVDSGGGYQGYWLLAQPFALDTEEVRAAAINAQYAWVDLWGGDKSAKDIARVLRLPGGLNHKYDPPRPVVIVEADYSRRYSWDALLGCLPAPQPVAVAVAQPVAVRSADGGSVPALWVERQIEAVRSAQEGTRNATTNRVAYRLGRLVGGGGLDEGGLVDKLTRAAVQAGLPEAEARKEAAGGLADGKAKPRTWIEAVRDGNEGHSNGSAPPEPPWAHEAPPEPLGLETSEDAPQRAAQRRRAWTAGELLRADFPEPRWLVPGLLPVGLGNLGARPKIGKSWLALQVAIAVGSGGVVFGQQVEQRRVLYLALEDSPRRMQDRMRKQGATANTQIDFWFEVASLGEGGSADLYSAIKRERYGLVVIDTFGRALGRADQNDLAAMTVASGSLQLMALDCDMQILLIDHHKKAAGGGGVGDVIDDIMGSTGKSGAVDVALGLYRPRGQREATLKVVGRDVEEKDLSLHFDRDTGCWQLLGAASDVRAQSVQGEIVAALKELGGKSNAAALARFLGKQPGNVTCELQELVNKGIVQRAPTREGVTVTYTLRTDAA